MLAFDFAVTMSMTKLLDSGGNFIVKQLAIIGLLFLLIPASFAQVITPEPEAPPEVVVPYPIPPRTSYVDYDDIADLFPDEVDDLPPQWAVGDTFAMVTVPRANLRSAPSTEEGVVADIAISGERFMIVGLFYPGESIVRDPETDDFVFDDPGEREVWYLIDTGGGAAWIFGGLVIVANPETLDRFETRTLTAEEQAYIDSQLAVAANTINVRYTSRLRSGPGTDYSQVGIIPFQARVSIIGRNEFSTWFYINYNGMQGWLSFSLLALPGDFDATAIPIIR